MASSSSCRFQCILTNDPDKQHSDKETLWLEQEEGKKSAFFLPLDKNDNTDASPHVAKPAHLLLQLPQKSTFLFGGIEMETNARNIEIYLTDTDGKETYLTTSRGLNVGAGSDDPHRFKCLAVCPGGPRPVTRVHFKLLSLKPASCDSATIHVLKLKGRLPPPTTTAKQEEASTNDTATRATTRAATAPTSSPPLTQADMGNAMAGVSLLVKSVETSLLQSVQASLNDMEKRFDARFNRLEYMMLQQQQALVQQQQQQQEQYVAIQQQVTTRMKQQHAEVIALVESLQAQLADSQEQLDRKRISETVIAKSEEANVCDGAGEKDAATSRDAEALAEESNATKDEGSTKATNETTEDALAVEEQETKVANRAESEETRNKIEEEEEEEERIQSELQEEDAIGEVGEAVTQSDDGEVVNGSQDEQAVASKSAEVDQEGNDDDVEGTIAVDSEIGPEDRASTERIPDITVPPVEASANEAETLDASTGSDEKESIESTSSPDEESESTTDSPAPKKRPVMESRDNAFEIPDLLSELTVAEMNQTETDDPDRESTV